MIQVTSRGDRFRYDANGKIVESLWKTGKVTCFLRIRACGDTIFKSKEIDAQDSCPPELLWTSVPKVQVCCDDWKKAKNSNQPCNPLNDADCDGIPNQEDSTPVQGATGTEESPPDNKGGKPYADLAVDIQAPHGFPLGVTPFAVSVKNHGPEKASGAQLTVSTSAAKLIYATSSQGECSVTGGVVKCHWEEINGGDTRSVSVQIRTETEGELTLTANAASATPDLVTENNQAKAKVKVKKATKGTWAPHD